MTLTPFFPSDENEVSGCFIAEPVEELQHFGVDSTVMAVSPLYYPRKRPAKPAAEWVRYPRIPGNAGLSSAGKLLYARLLRRIQRLHRAKPIHCIHAHAALPCGHAAALLCRRLDIPFVVTVHGLDAFNSCYRTGISAASRRQVSQEVYRAASTVICISGKVQSILQAGGSSQTSSCVVYNGVNPDLFSASRMEAEPLEILMVGNLLRSKGHELVLHAIKRLQPSFPGIRCRIIGEGPDGFRFEALVRALDIGPQVHFAGRQSRLEVAQAMRRCSVFALPSSNEGLGCVYLEAMSCAKPAIACRGQGIDEVIEHGKNGWLIPADGIEPLVEGLSALLGSAEMRAKIGAAARETILEKLTLSNQAQQLAELYRQAILRSDGRGRGQ